MTLRGFDSDSPLDGPLVRDAGGNFVIRYVGIPGNPKCIRRPELDSLFGAGVPVGFVFESWAGRATEGYDAGRADAFAVENYMVTELEIPDYPPVFYAVDKDVTFPQVSPYFQGVASVRECGGYGSAQVITGLLDNNLVTEVWQTVAWSRGVVVQRASVYQTGGQGILSNGTRFDENTARELGRWAYGGITMDWNDKLTLNDPAYGAPETETVGDWIIYTNAKVSQMQSTLKLILAELQALNGRPAAPVTLDATQEADLRNATEDAVATSVHDALQAAAAAFLPKGQ